MKIRQETPADYKHIDCLITTAFENAAHADGNEHDLVRALREGENYIPELSLVAEEDGVLLGHILFTRAKVEETTVLALAPLAVKPEYQGQGIGRELIQRGHDIAYELGYVYSLDLGSENYYPKLGYKPAHLFGIMPPFDVPAVNFMAIKINDASPEITGVLEYAKEFGI